MRLNNSEDTASKLVVSILDMELFFGFILSDSMIFNSFFNYTFICKKWVSELRRFGTTEAWSITASVRLSSRRFYRSELDQRPSYVVKAKPPNRQLHQHYFCDPCLLVNL